MWVNCVIKDPEHVQTWHQTITVPQAAHLHVMERFHMPVKTHGRITVMVAIFQPQMSKIPARRNVDDAAFQVSKCIIKHTNILQILFAIVANKVQGMYIFLFFRPDCWCWCWIPCRCSNAIYKWVMYDGVRWRHKMSYTRYLIKLTFTQDYSLFNSQYVIVVWR